MNPEDRCGFVPPTPGYAPCTRPKHADGPCAHPRLALPEPLGLRIERRGRWLQAKTRLALRRLYRAVVGYLVRRAFTDGEVLAILENTTTRRHGDEDHFYIYVLTPEGAYAYERTCGTLERAIERLKELKASGRNAIWLKNHTIRGAFY